MGCDSLQLRFLLRICCAFRCALKIAVSDLEVMFGGDSLRVADPRADNVHGVVLNKFRLAARPEVLKQLWPRLHTGAVDDSQ
jgi:hypothetical protein